jgi:hypothetical protein
LRQSANAQARRVFRAKIFINDDNGKAKFHGGGGREDEEKEKAIVSTVKNTYLQRSVRKY